MDSKDTFTLFSLGCREKKGTKLLMQMFSIMDFFFNYASNELKMVSRVPFKSFVFILFFYSPHRWNKSWKKIPAFSFLSCLCAWVRRIFAFSSSGVCGSCAKTCRREYAVSWCVRVREGEVTHGGHSSGQHQLSECEVQPQAKASRACRDKPDPPRTPTHTLAGPEPGAAPTRSYLPPSKSSHWSGTLYTLCWDFPSL